MNNLNSILKKQGGIKLIKQYLRSGTFLTALMQFIILGKSRTALEILRLSVQLKWKEKLARRYSSYIRRFDKEYDNNLEHDTSNKVWICWFQGVENAPAVVQKCIESVKLHLSSKDVTVITSDNMNEYVSFPEYILSKWKSGKISNTHMTDLLRLELLIRYGGMWLDATVLCTENDSLIPHYFFDSDLFFYQCLKPGRDGHSKYMSSWLISAKTNNRILMMTRYLCYEYWKTHNYMIDYFLLHDFMSIALEYYSEDWIKIVPRDNATPHELLLRLFDNYDDSIMNAIEEQTPFHKLSYKFSKSELDKEHTFYKYIIK